MNRLIRLIFSKYKRKHTLLIIELFFSFIAFFVILLFITLSIYNARTPLGFDYKNVNKYWIDFPDVDWETASEINVEIHNYLDKHPEVENTSRMQSSQFFARGYMNPFHPVNYKDIEIPSEQVELIHAKDDVADIFNIKLIEGRWFNSDDNASKHRPVVINQNLKQRIAGNQNVIGEIIDYCGQLCIIVGVSGNFKHKGDYSTSGNLLVVRDSKAEGLQYETWQCVSGLNSWMFHLIKFSENAPSTIEENIIKDVYKRFPGYTLTLLPLEKEHAKYKQRTWIPLLSILLVVLFLFLNVLFGLFGVLWYSISLRRPEIGLRMAVGANKNRIYRQFIGEMLAIATLGILPGIIIAAQFPLLNLFNIETNVYIIAILATTLLIYLLITLCALLPSARAAKLQPAVALHEE